LAVGHRAVFVKYAGLAGAISRGSVIWYILILLLLLLLLLFILLHMDLH
jgi:hypothetical protein